MNNDGFKVGDRIFFFEEDGVKVFGEVIEVNSDCTILSICTDDMQPYEICGAQIIKLMNKI